MTECHLTQDSANPFLSAAMFAGAVSVMVIVSMTTILLAGLFF